MDDDVKNDFNDNDIHLEQNDEVIALNEPEEVVDENELEKIVQSDPENGEDVINDEIESRADQEDIEQLNESGIDQGIDEPVAIEAELLEANKDDEPQDNPYVEEEPVIEDTEQDDNTTTIVDNEDDFNNEAVEVDSGHDTNEIYSQSGTANSRLMSADSIRHELDQNDEFYNNVENDETDNLNHLDRDTSSFDTVIHPMSADQSVNVNHTVHSPLIDDDNDVVLETVVNSIENGDGIVSMTERHSSAVIEVLLRVCH